MRKILAVLLTAFLMIGLTACLEGETSTPNKDSQGKNSQKTESGVSGIELPEDKFD